MIDATPPTPILSKAAGPGTVAAPAKGGFAAALALLLPGMAVKGSGNEQGDDRQDLAGDGKQLPDTDKGAPDGTMLPWIAPQIQLPDTATPLTLRLPPQGAAAPVEGESVPDSAEMLAAALLAGQQAAAGDARAATTSKDFADALRTQADMIAGMLHHGATADTDAAPTPAPAVQVPALQLAAIATPTATGIEHAVAVALGTDTAAHRTIRDLEPASLAPTASAEPTAQPQAVAATGDAQQGALDMRGDRWMGAMIDRIEALRDNADAHDTRIRLAPDALGTVDVSLRKDGDRVHVHFAAEVATTRSLLSDAAPRLSELAEARGLRLGNTSVDAGQSQGGQRERPPQPAFLPSAPPRADATDPDSTTDQRIA